MYNARCHLHQVEMRGYDAFIKKEKATRIKVAQIFPRLTSVVRWMWHREGHCDSFFRQSRREHVSRILIDIDREYYLLKNFILEILFGRDFE